MPKVVAPHSSKKKTFDSTVIVRLDRKSKALLKKAAELRGISVSDFVRVVSTEQARREVEVQNNVIVMTPDEQLAFWIAINETPVLTESQKRLGAMMRGEA